MNIRQVKALLAVLDAGGFSKAARLLHCTQSTVSHMIAELEKDWDATLLLRSKSGVAPTEDCRRLLPRLRDMASAADALESAAAGLKGDVRGAIRIGTIVSAATHVLPAVIRAFEAEHPMVTWELMLGKPADIAGWLKAGRADLGVFDGPVPAGLQAVTLFQDELMAVLPPKHPAAAGERLPEAVVNGAPFLLLADEDGHSVVADWIRDRGLAPDVRFASWEDFSILAMAEEGFGMGVIPKLMLRRTDWRVAVRPIEPPVFRTVHLACAKRDRLSDAARRFAAALEAAMRHFVA